MGKQVRAGRAPILAAAIDNFTRLGYHGTSMRDIAMGAGVTVGSIYHHFDSKQAILRHLMERTMFDLLEVTTAAIADARPSPRGELAAFAEAWALFHTTRQAEALIGASEIRSLEDRGRDAVVGLRDRQERLVRAIVQRGVDQGEFLTPYPVEATRAILTMGAALSTWYRSDGDLEPAAMAERFAEIALSAVGSRGPAVR